MVVVDKPEVNWLLQRLAREMREPFFVRESFSSVDVRSRRLPKDAAIMEAAEKLATSMLETLTDGYGFSALKADLPPNLAVPARRTAVRDLIAKHMREGEFDPGPTIEEEGGRTRPRAHFYEHVWPVVGGRPVREWTVDDAPQSSARSTRRCARR